MPQSTRTIRSLVQPKALLATLGVALIAWIVLGPMLLRREFRVFVRSDKDLGSQKLEWTKAGDPLAHGVWLSERDVEPDYLEIRPSGAATGANQRFEFWLYGVTDGDGKAIDVRGIVAGADPAMVQPGWTTFEGVPGVVYTGQTPGLLRIPIATRDVVISHAFTDMGGPVEFRFRGQSRTLDVYEGTARGGTLTLPAGPITSRELQIAQQLPTYRPASLRLSWTCPAGTQVSLESRAIRFSLLGWDVSNRSIENVGVAAADGVRVEGAAGSGDSPARFVTTGEAPALDITADYAPGLGLHLLGIGTVLGVLWAARVLWMFGRAGWSWLQGSVVRVGVAIALALVVVNLVIAVVMPVWVTSDGMDYIDGAAGIAFDHSLERIPLYKAPGLMFVLAACMRVAPDFLQVFAFAQAVFGLAASVLAFAFLKARVGAAWGLAAAVVVGLHPIGITYQSYLLRENLGATLYLAVAVGLVVLARPAVASSVRRTWAAVIVLGLICGAGAYVRENFQILFVAVPIAVLFLVRGPFVRRGMLAGAVLGVSLLTIVPYLAVKCWPNGVVGIVSGKTHANRALNVWKNEVTDGNDTAFLTHEEWLDFEKRARADQVGDYDYVGAFKNGSLLHDRLEDPAILKSRNTGLLEPVMVKIADEAVARNPLAHVRAIGVSFANQLGLWNFYWPSDASAGLWYATPYRGKSWGYDTNYMVGTDWMKTNELYVAHAEQLERLVAPTVRECTTPEITLWTRLFNEYMWTVQFLRPVVAVLFLVGVYRACRRGDRAIVAIGCTTLFMMGAAAVVVAPATDRFAAPFIPVVVCVVLHTIATWRQVEKGEPLATA